MPRVNDMKKDAYGTPVPDYYNKKLYRSGNPIRVEFHLEPRSISMPLVDDIELQRIDTFYNDIVSEYTKAFVKEKDQVIAQRLMMNLQQENARLKDKLKDIEKILDADCCVESSLLDGS